MILEGQGQYVYDENGRQYLDAYNNVQTGNIIRPPVGSPLEITCPFVN